MKKVILFITSFFFTSHAFSCKDTLYFYINFKDSITENYVSDVMISNEDRDSSTHDIKTEIRKNKRIIRKKTLTKIISTQRYLQPLKNKKFKYVLEYIGRSNQKLDTNQIVNFIKNTDGLKYGFVDNGFDFDCKLYHYIQNKFLLCYQVISVANIIEIKRTIPLFVFDSLQKFVFTKNLSDTSKFNFTISYDFKQNKNHLSIYGLMVDSFNFNNLGWIEFDDFFVTSIYDKKSKIVKGYESGELIYEENLFENLYKEFKNGNITKSTKALKK